MVNMELRDHMDNSQGNTIPTGKTDLEITSKETAPVFLSLLHLQKQTTAGRKVWHRSWGIFLRQMTQQGPQSPPLSRPKRGNTKKGHNSKKFIL